MTSPITALCSSHRSHTARTASSICGRTTATIRSWLSLIITSQGSIAVLAPRHLVEPEVDPAVACHLREGRRKARGAAILKRLDETGLDELDRDLDQLLARERVTDLDGGTLVGVVLAELLAREHRGTADPVSPGGRPVEDDQVPRPGRGGPRRPGRRAGARHTSR